MAFGVGEKKMLGNLVKLITALVTAYTAYKIVPVIVVALKVVTG